MCYLFLIFYPFVWTLCVGWSHYCNENFLYRIFCIIINYFVFIGTCGLGILLIYWAANGSTVVFRMATSVTYRKTVCCSVFSENVKLNIANAPSWMSPGEFRLVFRFMLNGKSQFGVNNVQLRKHVIWFLSRKILYMIKTAIFVSNKKPTICIALTYDFIAFMHWKHISV